MLIASPTLNKKQITLAVLEHKFATELQWRAKIELRARSPAGSLGCAAPPARGWRPSGPGWPHAAGLWKKDKYQFYLSNIFKHKQGYCIIGWESS